MLKHYFIAALRNMAANRLLSAIAIIGMAVGLTTAILMALVIRNQLTFDDFIPGHERIYMGLTEVPNPGHASDLMDRTHRQFAALLTLNIPQIESATRLMITDALIGGDVVFRYGNVTGGEKIYWADPNAFDVLPLPVLRGNPAMALQLPDGLVLPRTTALKYFGRDDIVGQILFLNGHPMTVRAVIADLPANDTTLESGIFASDLAPFLGFANYKPSPPGVFRPADIGVRTYFRLRPGTSIAAVQARAATLIKPIYGPFRMPLIRLDRIHLIESLNASVPGFSLNDGVTARLGIAALVGLLVLFIASVNFVGLVLARATRREQEVSLRKVCGARRRDLIAQFLGEAMIVAILAGVIATALSEWLQPFVNAFLQTGTRFDYWRDPLLLVSLLAVVVVTGVAAGLYPAFVLSGFRPASMLNGWVGGFAPTGIVRKGLVILQFAVLIVLAIAAAVVWQQKFYATHAALRVNTDQMLLVRIPAPTVGCPVAFENEVRRIAGVRGAACTGTEFLDLPSTWRYRVKNGYSLSFNFMRLDWSALALYGIKPVAGSLTARPDGSAGAIINQMAVKALGFASPQAAIGGTIPYRPGSADKLDTPILAVVPDFALDPVSHPVKPTLFVGVSKDDVYGALLHIKLDGQKIPEALAAIDRAWAATGQDKPIDRVFLDQQMQDRYAALLRDAQMFAACASIAIFLACIGLFGLSTAAAQRRTKETGIRKAMGAREGNIIGLLLWEFAQPVLWANLIAWPLAWWAMSRWLNGFAYHVPLNWWLFPAAGAATLLITLLTVAGQAWLVARRPPVTALRYE